VLVVEDNPVNQKLMVALLTKWGHRTVVACDGACGLEALERQHFDLVLMDIQMPVMDGIKATRSIRARERERGGHIPIIAITAHAAEQDRVRCLEAGVDRYLSKPMDSALLRRAIAELVLTAAREPHVPLAEAVAIAGSTKGAGAGNSAEITGGPVDFEQLKEYVGDDPELLAEVIQIFLADTPVVLESAARAIFIQDSSALEMSAHRLKGSLSTMGAAAAAETASLLEAMGRAGVLAGADELFARLRREVGASGEALSAWQARQAA
jgi:CheY-like chemotaxis protein/HPt (histidine-containing phosphotransfer) domain-containing protein